MDLPTCLLDGPSGCAGRPDLSAVQEIERALRRSPYLSVRSVTCQTRDGRLVLRGRVPTFYVKQIVHALVRSVCESVEVVDRIDVAATEPSRSRAPATTPTTPTTPHALESPFRLEFV